MSSAPRIDQLAAQQDYPPACLYLIATPIGNLADITLRSLECLARVDLVAAEDTRNTRKLLAQYGITKPLFALHQHNERDGAAQVVARLKGGARVAYLSDAGTPAISDPGTILVDCVLGAGLRVIPLPGASAAVCALSAAGISDGPFYFAGFLSSRRTQARQALEALANLPAQLVFFEAPHRIISTLELLAALLGGERRVLIARELTKLHESIVRLPLAAAADFVRADEDRQRGEFVLVVEGGAPDGAGAQRGLDVLQRLMPLMPLSEAVALAAQLTGAPRNQLYEQALKARDGVS